MSAILKTFAAYAIKEMKISKTGKKQLINFVANEASEAQIMAFLLDGKIVHLDEHAEQIVKDRFQANTKLHEAMTSKQKTFSNSWGCQFV